MIRKSRILLTALCAASAGVSAAADLTLNVEIPSLPVAEYHRPYVAIWVEDGSQTIAANLAVWYQVRGDHTKWLPDLRQWWRRGGRDLKVPVGRAHRRDAAHRPAHSQVRRRDGAAGEAQARQVRAGGRGGARGRRPRGTAHSVRMAHQGRATWQRAGQDRARRRGADAESVRGVHMKRSITLVAVLLAVLFAMAPAASYAARAWLLPSQTILARSGGWVTFDAANSDDLFSFNQGAMPIDALSVTGGDGAAVTAAEPRQGQDALQLRSRAARLRHLSRGRGG